MAPVGILVKTASLGSRAHLAQGDTRGQGNQAGLRTGELALQLRHCGYSHAVSSPSWELIIE